jgi:hypothetical protein
MNLIDLKAMVNPKDIKAAMDAAEYSFRVEDDNQQHAVEAAACWGYACLQAHRIVADLTGDTMAVIRVALIKRTVYELGLSCGEFFETYGHQKDDADVLMDAVLNGV